MVPTNNDFRDSSSVDTFSDDHIKPEHLSKSLDIGHGSVDVTPTRK